MRIKYELVPVWYDKVICHMKLHAAIVSLGSVHEHVARNPKFSNLSSASILPLSN